MTTNELTANQLRILEIFAHSDPDMCYNYSYFEDETGRSKAGLKKDFAVLRSLGLIYFARGLMTEDGEVAGSGYGVVYEKLREIEALIPKHEHRWNTTGDKINTRFIRCQTYYCHDWTTLPELIAQAEAESARKAWEQVNRMSQKPDKYDQMTASAQTIWAVNTLGEIGSYSLAVLSEGENK